MKTHHLTSDYWTFLQIFRNMNQFFKLYIAQKKRARKRFIFFSMYLPSYTAAMDFSKIGSSKLQKNQHPLLYACIPSTCKSVAIISPPHASHPSREFWVFATSLMQAKSRVSVANFADPSEFPARKSSAIWRAVRESPTPANVLF